MAEQPQLLQPNARREDMFGAPKQPLNASSSNPLSVLPTKLGFLPRDEQQLRMPRATSPSTTIAATCDTASVRSLDTDMTEQPQDLSMSAASSVSDEQPLKASSSSFTSPKKAFMMREAASRASLASNR